MQLAGKKGKAPAFQFYTGDWLKDPAVQAVSSSSRGIWINLLARMWEANPRGELRGKDQSFVNLSNTSRRLWEVFKNENIEHNFAEIIENGDIIIVRNRRMFREEQAKIKDRERKRRDRNVQKMSEACPENVLPPSSSSSSTSVHTMYVSGQKGEKYPEAFVAFWSAYPRRIEKVRAFKVWKARVNEGIPPADLESAATAYAQAVRTRDTEECYIKHPATFLGPSRVFEEWIGVDKADGKRVKMGKEFIPVTVREFDEMMERGELIERDDGFHFRPVSDRTAPEDGRRGTDKRRGDGRNREKDDRAGDGKKHSARLDISGCFSIPGDHPRGQSVSCKEKE